MQNLIPLAERIAALLQSKPLAGPRPAALTVETGKTDRLANMRAFATAGLRLLLDHLDGR